jgi:arabinose-5-phosphate isomerase
METFSQISSYVHPHFSSDEIKELCISVLNDEAQALLHCAKLFPDEAINLIKHILICHGRIIFSGMGKSGHIGRKCSATFSSLGIPSLFVHPAEALHGDLGMIQKGDLVIFLSKSGRGVELEGMIPYLQEHKIFVALLCCGKGSLASFVDCVVELPLNQEAYLSINAPTSSSTLMLAVGDALAVAVSSIKKFTKQDFAQFHPGGTLGRTMLLTVENLMHSGDALPLLFEGSTFKEVLYIMTSKKLGTGIVVDENKKVLGIITDGDLRRACDVGASVFERCASDIMRSNPKAIQPDIKALRALEIMEDNEITSLVAVEDDKVVGLIHIHDIVKAGIQR